MSHVRVLVGTNSVSKQLNDISRDYIFNIFKIEQ